MATENISICCFSSNRFNTGDKLIITSSITKDVYIRPRILLTGCHMQIYRSGLFTSTLVFGNSFFNQTWWLKGFDVSKWKISGLWTLLQVIWIFPKWEYWFKCFVGMPQYKWIYQIATVSQQRKQKIVFHAPGKERRYQYMKCLSFLGLCPHPWFQFYHENWK